MEWGPHTDISTPCFCNICFVKLPMESALSGRSPLSDKNNGPPGVPAQRVRRTYKCKSLVGLTDSGKSPSITGSHAGLMCPFLLNKKYPCPLTNDHERHALSKSTLLAKCKILMIMINLPRTCSTDVVSRGAPINFFSTTLASQKAPYLTPEAFHCFLHLAKRGLNRSCSQPGKSTKAA